MTIEHQADVSPPEISEDSRDTTIAELLRQIAERDRRISALKEQIVELNAALLRREQLIGDQEILITGDEPGSPVQTLLEKVEDIHSRLEAVVTRVEKLPDREDELAEARLFIAQVRGSMMWRLASLYWKPMGWLRRRFGG